MVKHYVNQRDFTAARKCLDEMQEAMPNVSLSLFLDAKVLRAIYGSTTNILEKRQYPLLAKHAMKNGLNSFEREDHESSGDEVEEEVSAGDVGF